ncbi:MAG: hypothetical protein K6A35_05045 [bacterium]|nr:hypothetical protein [bacterium]
MGLTSLKDRIKSVRALLRENLPFLLFLSITVVFFIFKDLDRNLFISCDGLAYYKHLEEIFIRHEFGRFNRFLPGAALLMSPFFLVTHFFVSLLNPESANGYTLPYQYTVALSALFYYSVGITLTYACLLRFFHRTTAVFTCFAITYGTLLPAYVHTCWSAYPHVYAFAACALFCSLVIYGKDGSQSDFRPSESLFLGLVLGVVFLIRNTNIIVIFFYLLYGLGQINYKDRLKNILQLRRLSLNALGFLALFVLLMLYWHTVTGKLFVDPYSSERFEYIFNPKICEVFFSDAKGLFIFSPILIFFFVGFFYGSKFDDINKIKAASLIIFALETYIYSAWWCWWLGAGYGERAFSDILIIFAPIMGAFFEHVFYGKFFGLPHKLLKILIICISLFFILNNQIFFTDTMSEAININVASWSQLQSSLKHFYGLNGTDWKIENGENEFTMAEHGHLFRSHFPQEEGKPYISQRQGVLLLGPHKRLSKGNYRIVYHYHFNGDKSRKIVGGAGTYSSENIFDNSKYRVLMEADSTTAVIDNFQLDNDCDDFEFIIYALQPGLELERIVITKLP